MPEREKIFYEKAHIKNFKFEDEIIKIYEWNKSDSNVLLVHGWEGRACQLGEFTNLFNLQGIGVISFDAIAHGESTGQMTTLFQNARLVFQIVETYQIKFVIAHSFGSITSLAAIKFLNLKITKLVCLGSPFYLEWIFTSFTAYFQLPKKSGIELINYVIKKFNLSHDYADLSYRENINAELLIIHDKLDKEVPYMQAIELSNSWKNSTLILTEHLGHRRILRDEKIIHECLNFIKGIKETSF
jgi:pimeloyl-ACP methyl ester carboxylesterase